MIDPTRNNSVAIDGGEAVWTQLQRAGLVTGAMPAPIATPVTPWFVRAMLGVAGWIGALFFLGFIAFAFTWVQHSAPAQLFVGALVCTGAALMFRAERDNEFMAQFAFALSLAGQALIAVGLGGAIKSPPGMAALLIGLVQAALFVFVAHFPHRIWCAWTAGLALAFALTSWQLVHFLPAVFTAALAWIWLSDGPYKPRTGPQWRAAGYGLALASVQTVLYYNGMVWRWLQPVDDAVYSRWIAGVLMAAVWLALVAVLLRRERAALVGTDARLLWLAAALIAVATFAAPGFAPLLALIVLGFAAGVRAVSGLGAIALLGYGVHYYYALELDLLQKSVILMATGAALLLARVVLHRRGAAAEVANA